MARFLLNTTIRVVVTLWLVITITFFLTRIFSGDSLLDEKELTPEARRKQGPSRRKRDRPTSRQPQSRRAKPRHRGP